MALVSVPPHRNSRRRKAEGRANGPPTEGSRGGQSLGWAGRGPEEEAPRTCGVCSTGTLPRGDIALNSAVSLSFIWLNSGMLIAMPLYSAAIKILNARKLAGYV